MLFQQLVNEMSPQQACSKLVNKLWQCYSNTCQQDVFAISLFIYLALPTRAGSPQQHMPITVGPFCLTHPVNFPCGRKPEYPEETHDFRQSVDFYSFHMRTGFESHWESSHWDLNLWLQRWKASALTTWPPKPLCSKLVNKLWQCCSNNLSTRCLLNSFVSSMLTSCENAVSTTCQQDVSSTGL